MRKKRGRKSNYLKSLSGEYWDKVKRKIRIRDNFECQVCGQKHNLETHHITYFLKGKSIRGFELENLEWLILLCGDCHEEVHRNKNHFLNPNNKIKKNSNEFKKHVKSIIHKLG